MGTRAHEIRRQTGKRDRHGRSINEVQHGLIELPRDQWPRGKYDHASPKLAAELRREDRARQRGGR